MASTNKDDDFGLTAYMDIQAELGQWGESTPTPRKSSPGYLRRFHDDTTPASSASTRRSKKSQDIANDDDAMAEVEGGGFSPSLRSPELGRRVGGPVGVQTPEPTHHQATVPDIMTHDDQDGAHDEDNIADENDFIESSTEQLIDDGMGSSYRPYHDALFAYLQSRERLSSVITTQQANDCDNDNDLSMMQIDDEEKEKEDAALADAEIKFLASLASICISRGATAAGDDGDMLSEASKNEGNLWDLMSALRSSGGGISSLFYCVGGEQVPNLMTLANDPTAMVDSSPADVLNACLGGDENNNTTAASLPLQRLIAALGWIEACHGRKFDEVLSRQYEGNGDPLLPPPRRRTMWPGTVAELQKQQQLSGKKHLFTIDAPPLTPEDETDDARLLRACFMLLQAGRMEEAMQLANDCGQPWMSVSWSGWVPLSSDGTGNPTRTLWKNQCRKIAETMAQKVNAEASSMEDNTGTRGLYPSSAYEAAILSLLSDNVDTALNNPVFQTWEDGVHAILRSELGVVEDDVLRTHNHARVEAAERSGGHFPHPGTEFVTLDDGRSPRGNDGDLGAALEKLEISPIERIREEGGDPFRNGMTSFLIGQNVLREYIEECAELSLEAANEDEACFLRFVTHLVVYVSTVLPDVCAQLALPSAGMDASGDGDGSFSLRELLILKYVAYLSSRRDLWPHVALYTSLLSDDNILDTYSSFLIHVHSNRERQMTLKQARDLFSKGMDLYILRNVVRGMIMCDKEDWVREAGEGPPPSGVDPADARMMRSIQWLCYYPEHRPDALVTTNMLLRRFLLSSAGTETEWDLYAPKVFIEKILPKDLLDVARDQCQGGGEAFAGSISSSMIENLEAEFLSIECYLKAHTKYVQFLDAIAKTSPCHKATKLVEESQSKHETEIADKMERNQFRQKKVSLCKIIVESASRVSDALMEVLTFAGGWLVDANTNLGDESEEAKARSEELKAIRSKFVPSAVFMLQEVLEQTGLWLEQIVYDTQAQFEGASNDMLLTLFGSFDESYQSNEGELTANILTSSRAAPGHWHKKALSLASIVANDGNGLHETFSDEEMNAFLKLMAEAHIKLSQSLQTGQAFFE